MLHNMCVFSVSRITISKLVYCDHMITEEWLIRKSKFDANSVKRSVNKLLPFLHRDSALMGKLDVKKIKKKKDIKLQV